MKLGTAIIWSLILSAVASVAFLVLTPPVDDFNTGNPYWNGLSLMASEIGLRAMPASGLEGIGAKDSVVIVIGPDTGFSDAYISAARSFAQAGGVLVVMDDFGTGNQLLAGLFEGTGIGASLSGAWLADPLYMHRSQYYAKVDTLAGDAVMDYGTALVGLSGDFEIIANSSAFSYLDENRNGRCDAGEQAGPFPVAVSFDYGGSGGMVIVVADPSMVINAVSGLEANSAFIMSLVDGRAAYVDTSFRSQTVFSWAKSATTGALSSLHVPEVRYLVAFATIFAIASVDWDRRAIRWSRGGKGDAKDAAEAYDEELERAIEEHPDWDRAVLERIAGERRKPGA